MASTQSSRNSHARFLARAVLLALAVGTFFVALGGSFASAALLREYESQLTQADGITPFSFTSPVGIATDGAGNVWVTDPGSGSSALDKFDPAGKFAAQDEGLGSFGTSPYIESAAWDAKANQLFVGDSNNDDLWGFEPNASYSGTDLNLGLAGCCYIRVAADNSGSATDGDLYVFSKEKIIRIDPSGAPVPFTAGAIVGAEGNELSGAETPAGSFGRPSQRSNGGIAVGPNGRFYVADGEHHVVDVFLPSGEFIEAIKEGEAEHSLGQVSAVAVDPSSGELFVADPSNDEIDVFSSGGAFVTAITQADGAPFGALQGIAGGPSGNLYVADSGTHRVDVFDSGTIVPDTITGPVSNLTDTSLTLNGTVNTAGATADTALTDCHFEYVTESAFQESGFSDLSSGGEATCVPAAGSIPNDGANHAVSADASGLTPGVVYRYRLLAANSNGANSGAVRTSPRFALGGLVANVSATAADLGGEIDPNGVETNYHVEYLTAAEYEANGESFSGPDAPTSPSDSVIPAGNAPVSVFQHVQGLTPGTEYRFRLAISSSIGTVHSQGRAFTAQGLGAFELPDGRQWEQVSPPDKRGSGLSPDYSPQASSTGDAIAYETTGATEVEPEGTSSGLLVLSARGVSSWSSRDLAVPHRTAPGLGGEVVFLAEDLSHSIVSPNAPINVPGASFNPTLSPDATEQTSYLRTDFSSGQPAAFCVTSCYRPLLTGAPGVANIPPGTVLVPCEHTDPPGRPCKYPHFAGASADVGHIIVQSVVDSKHVALTATPGDEGGLYEWFDGGLTLVSVLPGGAGPASPSTQPTLGSNEKVFTHNPSTVSSDGSRVVWSEGSASHGLYLRDLAAEETVQLDAVQGGAGTGIASPRFQFASTDGSVVYFSDEQQLTPGSGAGNGHSDLYRCDVVEAGGELACQLTDLTPESSGEQGDFLGNILGASADGSSVYFVANGVLASNQVDDGNSPEGAQPGNCGLQDFSEPGGTCSLYRSHDGTNSFIARLSSADQPDWNLTPNTRPARVSINGEWLAFMSQRHLTGYDSTDAATGAPDQEVFLYHASSSGLVCPSCNPTGARPHGVVFGGGYVPEPPEIQGNLRGFEHTQTIAASLPGWSESGFYQPRYLSNSGRLFFNSADALLPQDSNGLADVYEYEPPEVGGCTGSAPNFEASSGGCLALISAGTSSHESIFLDASESGDDAFFLTTSQLGSADIDTSYDVYDAHVCSAVVPCLPPPPPPQSACEGDACQLPATPPNDATPGSLSFHGAGNVHEPTAKKKRKAKKHKKKAKKRAAAHKKGGRK